MCIVIDTNTLASVFKSSSLNHNEFKPVLEWIINGNGKVVYGGTKYFSEIKQYFGLFSELKKVRKAVLVDSAIVDQYANEAGSKISHSDFDDQHLVGLLITSKCKLICSEDKRAYPYFRHKLFFGSSKNKPKIYRGQSNMDLLNEQNIAAICKTCKSLKNSQKHIVNLILNNK
ncbi:hypothetical protein GCM10028808_70970 [Spirosoma migulaei]